MKPQNSHTQISLIAFPGTKLFYVQAMVLGALSGLALPPFAIPLVLFITFPGLFTLLDRLKPSFNFQTFATGWWFGFGFFVVGLYWITYALHVDWLKFFWLIPFSLFGIPAILAIYIGLVTSITTRIAPQGLARCFVFAVLWTGAEWIRGHYLFAFPWNLIGYTWDQLPSFLQLTAFTGIYGVSLLTVLLATIPKLWGEAHKNRKAQALVGITLIVTLTVWGGLGYQRIIYAPSKPTGYQIRLVQPNVDQKLKWHTDTRQAQFFHLLKLSGKPFKDDQQTTPRIIIWPESAITFFLDEHQAARNLIAQELPENSILLTGSPRRTFADKDPFILWNSMFALGNKGEIIGVYDKFHLVPFGEYLPLRKLLPNIPKITEGTVDYSAARGPQTLELPGIPPVSPLICFEGIFPGEVKYDYTCDSLRYGQEKTNERPERTEVYVRTAREVLTNPELEIAQVYRKAQWLLNITNDAWYGNTSGPYQHFASIRVRAIEEGLPMVRVANSGISGIIDAVGRIEQTIGFNETGILDAYLPAPIPHPTIYAQYGDRGLWVMMVIFSLLGLWYRRRKC